MSMIVGLLVGAAGTAAYGVYAKAAEAEGDAATLPGDTTSSRAFDPAAHATRSAVGAAATQQVGFLSDLLAQLWGYINIAASQTIQESVEPSFKDLPGPLATLHFTKVDLGSVPIRLDNIVVHEVNKEANTLQFDLDVLWDGACDIELKADYIGSFGVKSIKLHGRMSILLKPLVPTLSVVNAVQYSFINPPQVDLDFVGLANFADIKLLKRRIHAIIQDSIKAMVVLPKRMMTKLDMSSSFMDIYHPPLGIIRVTEITGRGFSEQKQTLRANDVPDAYCMVSVGDASCRTKTIQDSLSPVWKDPMDMVLCDHDQVIDVQVYDEDKGRLDSDDYLGAARATVGEVLLAGNRLTLDLQEDFKPTGASITLGCELVHFTTDLTSLASAASEQQLVGFATVLITQAFDLPGPKKDVASFVKVSCAGKEFVTRTVVDCPGLDTLNPYYDMAFHFPLTTEFVRDGQMKAIVLNLMNGETCLGTTTIDHAVLAESPDKTLTEKRAMGSDGTALEFRVMLRGLQSRGVTSTAPFIAATGDAATTETKSSSAAEKTQVVRVTAMKGHGFQVEKRRRLQKSDIPDVYCNIKFGSSPTVWRTKTIANNLEPVWNEAKEYPLLNHSQIVHIDAFDQDTGRKDADDHLGSARVTVGKLLLAGGSIDVELETEGKPSGMYVTIRCELVDA
jgi:Ca2+-dependent lipid-binding protein